jgi:signal peptidase
VPPNQVPFLKHPTGNTPNPEQPTTPTVGTGEDLSPTSAHTSNSGNRTSQDSQLDQRAQKINTVKTVLDWVLTMLMVALLILATLLVVVPKVTKGAALTVLTGSMEPSIHPGDVVVVRGVDPARINGIQTGDVITFQPLPNDPTLVTHRVVGVQGKRGETEKTFITRGDANGKNDEPVTAKQVRGVMMYRIPWIGNVTDWAGDRKSWVALALGGGLVLYGAVLVFWPKRREKIAQQALADQQATDNQQITHYTAPSTSVSAPPTVVPGDFVPVNPTMPPHAEAAHPMPATHLPPVPQADTSLVHSGGHTNTGKVQF